MLVDGPYLQSEEQLGGFRVVACDETEIDARRPRRVAPACRGMSRSAPFQPA